MPMRFNAAHWLGFFLLMLVASLALAANTPCSGKKGGIARCDGELFLCNDGSTSGSKKNCEATTGGHPQSLLSAPPRRASASACDCGTGQFCTGPRGGVYCLPPSGNKSYRRH